MENKHYSSFCFTVTDVLCDPLHCQDICHSMMKRVCKEKIWVWALCGCLMRNLHSRSCFQLNLTELKTLRVAVWKEDHADGRAAHLATKIMANISLLRHKAKLKV